MTASETNSDAESTPSLTSTADTTAAPTSKWTVTVALDSRKRPIHPPAADDYKDWTLEQLKL
ncbi:Hypothetical protein PHPALM_9247 [Phytophthora palmivora]|uniref:Uncharacterized protein n=1 Tax=Phytophthora palmivora TaxID=4796 RepID=A0A2P4Y7S9_9STRA|nr:Hypothetical protein PHPALM_9247 [Phytophthora palmivora]